MTGDVAGDGTAAAGGELGGDAGVSLEGEGGVMWETVERECDVEGGGGRKTCNLLDGSKIRARCWNSLRKTPTTASHSWQMTVVRHGITSAPCSGSNVIRVSE